MVVLPITVKKNEEPRRGKHLSGGINRECLEIDKHIKSKMADSYI